MNLYFQVLTSTESFKLKYSFVKKINIHIKHNNNNNDKCYREDWDKRINSNKKTSRNNLYTWLRK